jgi:GNAT superfamily N-acetyltransferase
MPDQFSVQTAAGNDIDLILRMIREMAAAEHRQDQVFVTAEHLERYVFGEQPAAEVFLGYWDEDPVAYLMVQTRFSSYRGTPILYVEDLFVRARSRGQGLGKRMMEFAAQLAVKRECHAVHWSVGDWNGPGLAFYERLGATREQGRVHFALEGEALRRLTR